MDRLINWAVGSVGNYPGGGGNGGSVNVNATGNAGGGGSTGYIELSY